jgi:putative transcriptional regulator
MPKALRINTTTGNWGVDVRLVRHQRGLTQQAFADTFGFTIGAVRDWEQGRKRPDRTARVLLAVIQSAPEAVANAVAKVGRGDA